ncbi:hypothetical protein NUSPORA_00625 [Nucleospora cyclopteri]
MCIPMDLKSTTYCSRPGSFFGFIINAPSSLLLFIIGIIMCLRMITHTNSLHASIGRGEMKIILYSFVTNNFLLILSINFQSFLLTLSSVIYAITAVFQLSISSSLYFSIFASGITIDRIYGIMRIPSHTFLMGVLFIFSFLMLAFNFLGLVINNPFIYIISLFINTISISLYFLIQLRKLNKIKSDIWSYGVLSIIFFLYCFSLLPSFLLADVVAVATEKHLDNMFIAQLFNTILIMMVHKYWLQTCDFEIECLELEA